MRNVSQIIEYCSLGIEAYRFHGKGHKAGGVRKSNLGLMPRSESCLVGTYLDWAYISVTPVVYSSWWLFNSFSLAKFQWNSLRFFWTLSVQADAGALPFVCNYLFFFFNLTNAYFHSNTSLKFLCSDNLQATLRKSVLPISQLHIVLKFSVAFHIIVKDWLYDSYFYFLLHVSSERAGPLSCSLLRFQFLAPGQARKTLN